VHELINLLEWSDPLHLLVEEAQLSEVKWSDWSAQCVSSWCKHQ